jgi:hypothetical protein
VTRLRDVRPEDFLRAGAVFGRAAEELDRPLAACRRSASVRWVGRPNQQYQRQLGQLARDLRRVQQAYDEACNALLSYSRALEPVVDLALRADLLEAQAEDLRTARDLTSGMRLIYGPATPEEQALRDRATLLRAEASQQELLASGRLVAVLRSLADDAPHLSGWTSVSRSAAAFAPGASDQVRGVATVATDVALSLPLVGNAESRARARKELWAATRAMAQPWLAVEELLDRLSRGQYAYASGNLGAALVLRVRGARGRAVEKFGAHDAMHPDVLWGLKRGGFGDADLAGVRAWVEQRAQRELLEALLRLEQVPLPSLEELIGGRVDLLHQEAHGGHTLLRHIGRDVDFLRMRQLTEPGPGGVPIQKSSFLNLDEAEEVVTMALRDNAAKLVKWYESHKATLQIVAELQRPAGLLVGGDGELGSARSAIVRLARLKDGSVIVTTAYLKG